MSSLNKPSKTPLSTAREEFFNTTGAGAVYGSGSAIKGFSLQVRADSGTPLLWDVRVEGSLDGVNFYSILTHTNEDVLNSIVSTGSFNKFVSFYRVNVLSLTLGTSPAINVSVLEVR